MEEKQKKEKIKESDEVLWDRAVTLSTRSTEDLFLAGEYFCELKKRLGYGSFGEELQNRGIDHFRVCEIMSIFRKLGEFAEIRKVAEIRNFNRSKLLILSRMPDAELQRFSEDGELYGNTADEIAGMTYEELKNKYQKLKNKLDKKNKKIDEIEYQQKKDKFSTRKEKKLSKDIREMRQRIVANRDRMLAINRPDISPKIKSQIVAFFEEMRVLFASDYKEISESLGYDDETNEE